jgi:hypothetical protein
MAPAIVEFYHTEEYPRVVVKRDVYNFIRDIVLYQTISI